MLWLGILFSVLTAVATNLAFLWKHRGAVAAPPVDVRHLARSAAQLFRSRWWAIGWSVAVLGWVFHVGALAFAPLSLAQAVISGGFVILAVLAERLFGFALGRRQWVGVLTVATGLAILGATSSPDDDATRYSVVGIAIFQGVLLLLGVLLAVVTRHHAVHEYGTIEDGPRDQEHPVTGGVPQAPITVHPDTRLSSRGAGVLLGAAAGLAFGVSDVSIKALAEATIGDASSLLSPWTATAVLASIAAFYASARSLQIGEGLAVITATSAAANLVAIAGGILVFGEHLGNGVGQIALRTIAFLLVIAGAALVPGPLRAAEAEAEHERHEQHEPRFRREGARAEA
jgi:hypothetical protein